MNSFWFVGLPLVVVLALALLDIARHPISTRRKIVWGLACALVWPAIIAWYLLRPTPGRMALASRTIDDRRNAAVSAVLERSDGRLTREELRDRLQQLAVDR